MKWSFVCPAHTGDLERPVALSSFCAHCILVAHSILCVSAVLSMFLGAGVSGSILGRHDLNNSLHLSIANCKHNHKQSLVSIKNT
jgi:hypothetical protein